MKLPEHQIESRNFNFSETTFKNLMQKRIYKVLIICSNYDFFMLEEDGRVDEQIFNEYVSLSLRYPPIFLQASTAEKAFKLLAEENVDLIITMLNVGSNDAFELSKMVKATYPRIPIVVLTHFSREVTIRLAKEDLSAIDYVFCWLGNADIFVAIIKLIEDKMNLDYDLQKIGVQAILLVEDSIRFYSSYLPNIYKIVLQQAQSFMQEGLNEHKSMLLMRGRPKIILATSYDEAVAYYEKYKNNLLGVISDISYARNGVRDKEAGIKLARKLKAEDPYFPVLLQSSDEENQKIAKEIKVGFINKNSDTLLLELRNFINYYFAFGDFIFENPNDPTFKDRATNLKELQHKILTVPDEVLEYHIHRNHFSKWLRARAMFPIAVLFKKTTIEQFPHLSNVRQFLFEAIYNYRRSQGRGVIAKYNRKRFDEYQIFSRIGEGSIGGKARGLAFVDSLIKKYSLYNKYEDVTITIPRTVVISTDVFDEFMLNNKLYKIALSDLPDEEIYTHFINATLPANLYADLKAFISVIKNPLAIRSSSVLEDSHYQPFAGIYSTYMIPNVENDPVRTLKMLTTAIKGVYASVYFKSSKSYMKVTKNLIDEEKMGIILQEICGAKYNDSFYPTFSGVARSTNVYAIDPELPKDGVANVALGLGRTIVDGGVSLRFCPVYPQKVLQLSSPEMALRDSQKTFYALDLNPDSFKPSVNEAINFKKLTINQAAQDGSINHIASSFDLQNNVIRDGVMFDGKKIITFANILKHNVFPLADILKDLLRIGEKEMNLPIEIEFAANLNVPKGQPKLFNFLQIRPIVDNDQVVDFNLDDISDENTIIQSKSALGNGVIKDVYDFVYIKPQSFNAGRSKEIAEKMEKLNDTFLAQEKGYYLVGPGRWGSSDPWLGIPVKWAQISAARLIVEAGLHDYRIDPSQGTHFFQNLTSFRVGYFTINPFIKDGFYDIDYLNQFEAVYEDEFIRQIHFEKPLIAKIDGAHNRGVIYKVGKDA